MRGRALHRGQSEDDELLLVDDVVEVPAVAGVLLPVVELSDDFSVDEVDDVAGTLDVSLDRLSLR